MKNKTKHKALVSVIIPIHNIKKAEQCIKALNQQTYKNIEIIPVDFKGFPAEKRNYGFRKSKGDFVLFLDEDEYLSPTTIEECVKKAEENYDIIRIPVLKKAAKTYFAQCLSILRESTTKDLFFKRNVLEKIGLFDSSFILCDDLDILERARRAGFNFALVSKSYMIHDEDLTLKSVIIKTFLARRGFRKLKDKYGEKVFTRIVKPTYHRMRIIKFLLKQPKYLPGVFLIMSLRFLIRRLP
jgi:glycosyltransferase involved in cell wall biosynthesis